MSGGNDARADGYGRIYQATGDQRIVEHHHHAPDWAGPDSVRHPAVGRGPVVLRDRVGEMDRLRAAVEPGAGNRAYVLHGMGGCGKTAVAHTLFRHATDHAGRIGLWVNASDPASLRAGDARRRGRPRRHGRRTHRCAKRPASRRRPGLALPRRIRPTVAARPGQRRHPCRPP